MSIKPKLKRRDSEPRTKKKFPSGCGGEEKFSEHVN